MLTLRALGSTYIEGPDGQPLGGAATQRRLVALLALLAIAGDEGLTRDRILGLLWPEGDPERARHALTQSLYHARRALGRDDLFVTGGGTVRLDRARLTSDVAEFRQAVAAGDDARAATLYRGPFLDGFFLSGAPEFEQWVAAQRARLDAIIAEVLLRLASEAERRGAPRDAVAWSRRLVVLDPLDSTRAVRLVSALARAGDRAGALQHARLHREMLRQELDIEPPAQLQSLERELRAGNSPSTSAVARPSPAVASEAVVPAAVPVPESAPLALSSTARIPRGYGGRPARPGGLERLRLHARAARRVDDRGAVAGGRRAAEAAARDAGDRRRHAADARRGALPDDGGGPLARFPARRPRGAAGRAPG